MSDDQQFTNFSSNQSFRPGVLAGLTKNDMEGLLDAGYEVGGTNDVAIFNILPNIPGFPKLQLALALSPEFMDFMLKNDAGEWSKPDASEVMQVFGAPGVLSLSPAIKGEEEHPQRTAARDSVKTFFNGELPKQEFGDELNDRIQSLVGETLNNPEEYFEDIMKRLRLNYLRTLYFSESITQEEMQTIYDYTESVFGSLLSLSVKTPIKNITGRSWHEMTPKNLKEVQAAAEEILLREIDMRLDSQDSNADLLSHLVKNTRYVEGLEEMDMKMHIISNFLQILFASADTTASAIGSSLKTLALDPELQESLRQNALNILATKDNGTIDYQDVITDNPDMREIMKFVGHVLRDDPPTPTTARKPNIDILLKDGTVIKAGTNVFIALSEAAMRELGDSETGDPKTFAELMGYRVFGGGPTMCVGRPFALYEIAATVIKILAATSQVHLDNPEEVRRIVSSTLHHEQLNFRFEMSEA